MKTLILLTLVVLFSIGMQAQTPTSNCSYATVAPTPLSGQSWPAPSSGQSCGFGIPYVTSTNFTNTYNFTISCYTNDNTVNPPPDTLTSSAPWTLTLQAGCSGPIPCPVLFGGASAWYSVWNGYASSVPGNNWVGVQGYSGMWVSLIGIKGLPLLICTTTSQYYTGTCAATACPCDGQLTFPHTPAEPKKADQVAQSCFDKKTSSVAGSGL